MSKESRLVKNTAILAVGNLFTKGIGFLLLPLYTSILNAEEYGIVDIIATYSGLCTIVLTLQLEQGLFRFLVEARGNEDRQWQYIRSVFALVTVILVLFLLAGEFALTKLEYKHTGYLLMNTLVQVFGTIMLQIPRGMGNTVEYAVGSFLSGVSAVILNVLFVAVFRWGVAGMLTAGIVGNVVCSGYIFCRMKLYRIFSRRKTDCLVWKELLKFSLPLIPYTLCWWVIGASDRIIISYSIGIAANGVYAVANKFSSLYNMASGIFQTAWMESAYETAEDANGHEYYCRIINVAFRFYSACNVLIIAVISYAFCYFVDMDYRDAYQYIPILLTASMLHSVSAMYGAVYFALKMTRQVMYAAFLTASVNILVNLMLIQRWKLYAAALSTLVAYYVILQIRYVDIKSKIGVAISRRFIWVTLIVYGVIAVGYYSGNAGLKAVSLVTAVLYAIGSNKKLLVDCILKVKDGKKYE